MAFTNSILSGETIARDSIHSLGYVAGVSGWSINRDGTAEFLNVVIRGDLESNNYVAGVSGWKLDQTGTAEINELTARGTVQSSNFSTGVSGWQINDNGSAEFNNVVIRSDLESSNYVAGVSGWKLDETGTAEINELIAQGTVSSSNFSSGVSGWEINDAGSAEFNDAVVRGEFATGFAGDTRIEIIDTGINGAQLNFHSDDATEAKPARIQAFDLDPSITMSSADWDNEGRVFFTLTSPHPALGNDAAVRLSNDFSGDVLVTFPNEFPFRLGETTGATLSSTGHAFQIGDDDTTFNMAFDRNSIQSRNNGAAETLELNPLGGGILSPDMQHNNSVDSSNSTSSATYVNASTTANETIPAPPSGRVTVILTGHGSNSGAGTTFMGFEIRETDASGTILLAAADARSGRMSGTTVQTISRAYTAQSLTTTGNLYIQAMFRAGSGTATVDEVSMCVIPSP